MLNKREETLKEFDRKISKLESEYRSVKKENKKIKEYVYMLAIALVIVAIAGFVVLTITGNAIYEDYSMIITEQAHWKMNDNVMSDFSIVDSLNGHTCTLQAHDSSGLTTTGKINSALYNGYGGSYSCIGGTYRTAGCIGDMSEYCNQWDGQSASTCGTASGSLCSMEDEGYGNDCHPNPNCDGRNAESAPYCSDASAAGCSYVLAGDCSEFDATGCTGQGSPCSWSLTGQSYDYAVCDASTIWNTAPFTISFWTKGTGHTGHWLGMLSTGADAWRIEGSDNPYLVTDNVVTAQATTNFNDGNWHMATATMNASGFIKWYSDAKLESTYQATAVDGSSDTMEFWKVGGDAAAPMTLDDIRFYSGEMNVDQIKQLYAGGLGTEEEIYFNSTSFNVSLDSSIISEEHYSFINFENSLKGWWRGEGNALDSSGNGYTGTWSGTPAYSNGLFNSSFSFDGDGTSKINFGNLNTKREFTLSMWVNADSLAETYQPLFVQRESCGALNMQLYAKNAGQCSGYITGDLQTSSGTYQLCGTTILNAGQWYHLVETYDGNSLKLYLDGVLNANLTAHGDFVTNANSYLADDGCSNYFNGTIDEVLFFDRALNAEEILALNSSSDYYSKEFITTSYVGTTSVSSPILQYKMNDNSATQLVIDTNGVYNGTSSVNTSTKNTTGKINNALIFNGNTIDTGSNFSFLSDGNFTVSTWFKVNSQGSVDGVFANGAYHTMYFTSYHASFGGMYFGWYDNTNTEQSFNTGTLATTGVWHHMAVTKVGTLMSFYYDGKAIASKTTTATLAYPTNNLKLGTDGYGNNFNGNIDDFRLYDYGLTAGAIANIYNRNLGSENETFGTYEYSSLGYAVNTTGEIYTNSSYSTYTVEGGTENIGLTLSVASSPPPADTSSPTISISFPTDITYSTSSLDLNYSASDDTALDSCWYSFDAGVTPSAPQVCGTNWTGLEASEGENRWTVYANDTAGNTNSIDVFFSVDSINPAINFTSPTSSGTITADAIYVNLTTSDTNIHYSFLDLDNSLKAWYRMDDIDGSGNPTDLSSYSFNGTAINGAVQNVSGMFGKSFSFDGINDFVNTSHVINDSSFSASVWFKTNSLKASANILNNGYHTGSTNDSWQIRLGASNPGTLLFVMGNGTANAAVGTTSFPVVVNTWKHAVVTYNGSSGTGKVYHNGVLNYSGTFNGMTLPTNSLKIGSDNSYTNNFNGSIDEVMIFNRVLSASEVSSLYNATAVKYENNFTSLSYGSHNFIGYAVDSAGNRNQTETRTVTFVDGVAPTITITNPSSAAYSINSLGLNYTASDETALDSCWYYNGTGNTTITCGNNATLTASEGSNTWIVYANDSNNNVNSSSITFIIDSVNPGVNFTAPTPSGSISGNAVYVNLTTSDANQHYSFADFSNSLLGWWRGEDNTSDENGIYNASWNGNSIYGAGRFGSAFKFNKTNGYVNTSHIFNESTFSVGVWFKANSLANGSNILNNGFYSTDTLGPENKSWQLRLGWANGAKIWFCVANSTDGTCLGNSTNYEGFPGYLFANTWYHVVATYNGSNGNASFYINGIMNWSDSKPNMVVSTEALLIGKDPGVSPNTIFDGLIDDVLLFNRVLSASEVSSLYNATAVKYENNFTSLSYGSHNFIGYAVDSAGNRNQTETRSVSVPITNPYTSCLEQCTQGSNCTIVGECYLNSSMCTGSICQFTNLTIGAQIHTWYDASGNGNDLNINLTSNETSPLLFLSGGSINFSGQTGTTGGNGGIVNISVINLLNTTSAFFYGIGGDSSEAGIDGGAGGTIYLNFHGLIRKFTDSNYFDGNEDPLPDNTPILVGGSGGSGGSTGNSGTINYSRTLSCPLDPDIDADGVVYALDRDITLNTYSNRTGDSTYNATQDINCDSLINVIELSREGFQWATRGTV